VKTLIANQGEFFLQPAEYELYNSIDDLVVDENVSLADQGVNGDYYLSVKPVA
jgi:hypothetical protein